MLICAYCDEECQPTREHVIPDWYNRTPGEAYTFSARSPLRHKAGDILVKDVCSHCNNVILSALDSYGKSLYDQHFAQPIYSGEAATFKYDGDQLIRWLLKLSYNSARAQNADIRALRLYRHVMIGKESIPNHIRCWVSLVTPTFLGETDECRPAKRHESGSDNVQEPLWFRLTQFRMAEYRADHLVQRQVIINSFRFTIVVAPFDSQWPSFEFGEWCSEFEVANPDARPIYPGMSEVMVDSANDHVGTSFFPLMRQYPTRFLTNPLPEFEKVLRGEVPLISLQVVPEMIQANDTSDVASALRYMISTRENAMGMRLKSDVFVSGYEDDPRALWQIPKVREFFRKLFLECPFVMLLAHPNGCLVKLMMLCWIYEDDLTDEMHEQRMVEFLEIAFQGLNEVAYRYAISEEVNREVCFASSEAITGQPYVPE